MISHFSVAALDVLGFLLWQTILEIPTAEHVQKKKGQNKNPNEKKTHFQIILWLLGHI